MSKSLRWTIYIIVTIAVMGFGFWLTYTQRPDTYMPRDAPDPAVLGDIAHSEDDGEQADWVIEISGIVEGRTDLHSDDEHFIGLQLAYQEIVELQGSPPEISSPVLALASKEFLETELGEIPTSGDRITIESEGAQRTLLAIAVRSISVDDSEQ